MVGPLAFGVLVALAVLSFFGALWGFTNRKDPVDERLEEYGADSDIYERYDRPYRTIPVLSRLVNRSRLGPRLAKALYQAALPLTPTEFVVIILSVAGVGLLVGTFFLNILMGMALGLLFSYLPVQYLRFIRERRRRAFTDQLPDVLSLLVGALRSGYGLSQSMNHLVEQMQPPASEEFDRTLQAMDLGIPLPRALEDMVDRVGSDDLEMMVLAITVQQEVGGNLAQTLDTIGETVRERIRILREIRVLTAQQRFTGYVLAFVPAGLAIVISMVNPKYFEPFFEPGRIRMMPVAAVVLMILGFLVIRKIADIEV